MRLNVLWLACNYYRGCRVCSESECSGGKRRAELIIGTQNVDIDANSKFTELGMQLMQFLVSGKENVAPEEVPKKKPDEEKVVKLKTGRNARKSQSEDEEMKHEMKKYIVYTCYYCS